MKLLLIFAIYASPAWAADYSLSNLCAKNPFLDLTPPQPTNASDVVAQDGKPMSEADESKLQFDQRLCGKNSSPVDSAIPSCNLTYGKIFRGVYNGKIQLKEALDNVCTKAKNIASQCNGQAEPEKCTASIDGGVASDLRSAIDKLNTTVSDLKERQERHNSFTQGTTKSLLNANNENLAKIETSAVAVDSPDQYDASTISGCSSSTQGSGTCEQSGAAANASFYGGKLKVQIKQLTAMADQFAELAAKSNKQGANTSTPPDPKEKSSGLFGGMGLDDLIKLGTVGAAGAALYCAATQNCSQQNSTNTSGITDQGTKNNPSDIQPAQSPGPQTDPLVASPNGTGTSQQASSKTTTPTSSGNSPTFNGGYSGSSDPILSPFKGDLGNGASPNAAQGQQGATSGGAASLLGSNGGSVASSSTSTDTGRTPAGTPSNGDVGSGSFGGGSGGGMGSSSTGFNLGDSKTATPADTALKNILNGDTPPGDLANLNNGINPPEGSTASAGNDGQENPESLFLRIRDAHNRCLKRGCVGFGVGNNI